MFLLIAFICLMIFLKRCCFIHSLKASWNKDSMHNHHTNPFLRTSQPLAHLFNVFSVRLYGKKGCMWITGLWCSLCSALVRPQMKNCAKFINSLELWERGYPGWKKFRNSDSKGRKLGWEMFSLGKAWLKKEKAGMIPGFNNRDMYCSMWKIQRGKYGLIPLSLELSSLNDNMQQNLHDF